jgi:poly(3-hydroxybutyrate) depolymerase
VVSTGGGISSGGAGTGGLASSGGQAAAGSSTAGNSSGGNVPGGGSSNAGNAGRAFGGSVGLGGASAGGSGGKGNGGTPVSTGGSGGGGSTAPMPSMGCGKSSGRPTSANVPNTIVSFPDGYDGSTPMPLVFGFHGAGRTNEQFRTADARTQGGDLEKQFVMAYLKSAGSGWVIGADTSRLDTALAEISNNYCIDTRRVFATGHSSGAQFIVQLLCAKDRRFRAIAPVASSVYCQSWEPIPTLLIHGKADSQRGDDADGKKDLAPYVSSNGCGTSSMPYSAVAGCTSGSTQVAPGCVEYQGCSKAMIWCNHNDPNYSGTNHGWPCFANKAIFDFFSAQK